jgi:peptide/nickel transport system substrate-binding protein
MLFVMISGCGSNASDPKKVGEKAYPSDQKEQVLRLGAARDFKSAAQGRNMVFEYLVSVDHEGNPVPMLAELWEIPGDSKTYVFKIREGVTFHNGTEFDASLAKFALEYNANNSVWGKYLDKIETVDGNTVKVYLKDYYPLFLQDLAKNLVVSPDAVDPKGDPSGKLAEYIGTGPFKLVSYHKDRDAELVRNDNYWGKKSEINRVIWKTIPDPHAQIVALKAGDVDMIGITEHHSSVPYVEVPAMEDAGINVDKTSYGRYQVLEFNTLREPFNDRKVRMAFNYAIDKEKMVRELFHGLTEPAYTITAPWFKYGPSKVNSKYFHYDLNKAKSLLTEAGWSMNSSGKLEKEGKPLEVELLIPAGEANADAVAIFVQSELKKIGVELKLLTLESGAAWDRSKQGEYEMFVHHSFCLPWVPGGIDIGGKYHSGSTSWPAAYHSPELDRLIEEAWLTPDESKRKELINKVWDILHYEAPCIPLYDIVKVSAYRESITGFKPAPTMFDMDFSEIKIN